MGLSVEEEFRCPKSCNSIDMQVHDICVYAKSSTGRVGRGFWEWDQLTEGDEKKEYLMGKLHIS